MFVFYVSVRFSSTTSTPTSRKWAKTQRISSRCSLRWAHHHYYYYNNYYCYYQSSVYFSLFWQTFSHVDHFFVTWFRSWRASVWIFPMMQLICPSTGPRTDTPTSSHVTLLHISSRWFSHTSVQRRVCVCVVMMMMMNSSSRRLQSSQVGVDAQRRRIRLRQRKLHPCEFVCDHFYIYWSSE